MSPLTASSFPAAIDWAKLFALEEGIGLSIIRTDGIFRYCSPGFLRKVGISTSSDLTGINLLDVFEESFAKERIQWLQKVSQTERPARTEHVLHGRAIASTLMPLQEEPFADHVLVLSRSIASNDEDNHPPMPVPSAAAANPEAPLNPDAVNPDASGHTGAAPQTEQPGEIADTAVSPNPIPSESACSTTAASETVDGVSSKGETFRSNLIDLGPLSILGKRELEVLILLGNGYSVPETARFLYRSPRTVERHKAEIGRKIGASTIADIVSVVCRAGLRPEHRNLTRINAVHASYRENGVL
ncbi:LuxR family transcriptional regulator [Rubripirellula lacrimiformis]|uniref:LuxR family transcriptional regulator n=1 Tax=Rubripirellula lacrimiformis TaxID=1930273 RepID=UPI001FECC53C|nr:LuxR C-terminal-related transcriptional regulator [Rubripirellula lacrimiformis]